MNEIVARRPEALGILDAWGLDTCCGGALPLGEAAARHGLDPLEVLRSLEPVP
jgi:iron-sulfur cluster repair protein YtfE (RIC family)